MANKKIVLCDTNILIAFYKNDADIISKLRKIGQPNIAINSIIVAELIYGALNKRELQKILRDVDHLHVLDITPDICNTFLALMAKHSLSHNLTLPDAIIAATAIYHDIPLFTLNRKDFNYLEPLRLYE